MQEAIGRTALVTGGHGFLGSHLVDLLLNRGYSVRCLMRPGRDSGLFGERDIEVVRGDLRHDEGLDAAVEGADYVFHVAGLIAARGPAEFDAVNIDGTRRLAEAVRRAAPACRRFLYVSSQAAAGPSPDGNPIDEDRAPDPLTHYGRSKLGGERVLSDVPSSVVRPPAIYGPRDEALLPFFSLAARGWMPDLDGKGRRFNLLHARDVAEGALAAAESEAALGRCYFLSDGPGYSYPELREVFGRVFGRKLRRIPLPDLLLDVAAALTDAGAWLTRSVPVFGRQKAIELKTRWWVCSPRRAEQELGWRPRIGLEVGVAETANWYRAEGRIPRRGSNPL
ncbi:MAG: NAD-dependent epimerase/dehydratase family protein [Planctomycetota bacterium]|jgi:nucleoside-diphosphate-sugar epimerase